MSRDIEEHVQQFATRLELLPITSGELGPPLDIVAVPLAQLGGRSDVAEPEVDRGDRPAQATRPEAVDEDSIAVRLRRQGVDPFCRDGHRRCRPAAEMASASPTASFIVDLS